MRTVHLTWENSTHTAIVEKYLHALGEKYQQNLPK